MSMQKEMIFDLELLNLANRKKYSAKITVLGQGLDYKIESIESDIPALFNDGGFAYHFIESGYFERDNFVAVVDTDCCTGIFNTDDTLFSVIELLGTGVLGAYFVTCNQVK